MKPEERERPAQAIVADHRGIYGAEVCQVCGEIGVYEGFYGALGSHWGGQFVCLRHHHSDEERAILKGRGERFCEQCLIRVSRTGALRLGHSWWLCRACANDPAWRDDGAADPLRELSKRRYLDRRSDTRIRRWGYSVLR
jgi:hypothetical protein